MKHSEQEEPRGLIIDVARLAKDGEHITGSVPAEVFGYDPDDLLFTNPKDLFYSLDVRLLGGELLVRGSVSEEFTCLCVRCGREFQWTAADDDVLFSMEVSPDDFADLTEELRQSIVLSFPNHPLCDEDCKGVCFKCGANLNDGPCGCAADKSGGWNAFSGL